MTGKNLREEREEMDAYGEMGQVLEGIWSPHVCILMGMIHKAEEKDAEGEGGRTAEVRGDVLYWQVGNGRRNHASAVVSLVCGLAFHSFGDPQSTMVQKQMVFLLTNCQKVSSGFMLYHNAYIILLASSRHVGIL